MGFMDALSGMCACQAAPRTRRHLQKGRQLETVEMKVRIDCDGCESKIRRTLEAMDGVTGVEVAPAQNRVTVTGYVDAAKVMRRVARKTGKRVEPWPYVPYDVVAQPYAPGVYDRKAPPGYVRDVVGAGAGGGAGAGRPFARASSTEAKYTGAFSDENPNAACAVIASSTSRLSSPGRLFKTVLSQPPSTLLRAGSPSWCCGRSSSSRLIRTSEQLSNVSATPARSTTRSASAKKGTRRKNALQPIPHRHPRSASRSPGRQICGRILVRHPPTAPSRSLSRRVPELKVVNE